MEIWMGNKSVAIWLVFASLLFVHSIAVAQQAPTKKSQKSGKLPRSSIALKQASQGEAFYPTCNLDSNSVGFHFFPANLGAKWTLRTVSQYLDAQNTLLKSDTVYSFERIVSDSSRTLQGLPVIGVESSLPYHAGEEANIKVQHLEYYVDDSVVMTVFNHSISSGQNHFMLVNPLKIGASWKDVTDDTIWSRIVALDEQVSVPIGSFDKAIVVQTNIGFGELSKYFVPGVGIVKTIFRGVPPNQNGAFVATSELVSLDRGNEERSIKQRFHFGQPVQSIKSKKTKQAVTKQAMAKSH